MRTDAAAEHLALALQHLGTAQAVANRLTADSFTTDIPNGRPINYARAAIYADRIDFIRQCVRDLIDPPRRPRTLEPATPVLPADAA
jgi:hypothetical protein